MHFIFSIHLACLRKSFIQVVRNTYLHGYDQCHLTHDSHSAVQLITTTAKYRIEGGRRIMDKVHSCQPSCNLLCNILRHGSKGVMAYWVSKVKVHEFSNPQSRC